MTLTPFYKDDLVAIYCGNSAEIRSELPQPDHVITDPPYSAYTHKNAKTNLGPNGTGVNAIDFECIGEAELRAILSLYCPARWLIATMEYRHIFALEGAPPQGLEFVRFGVWLKNNPMPQISGDRPTHGWEGIAYLHNENVKKRWNGGGRHGNWFGPTPKGEAHPTAKPISLITRFVDHFTDPNELIIDPFMGAGTTLIACKNMGRHAIGIELEERYCEVAAKRLAQETFIFVPEEKKDSNQCKLLDSSKPTC